MQETRLAFTSVFRIVPIVVVCLISAVTCFVFFFGRTCSMTYDSRDQLRQIRIAALFWQLSHSDSGCPTAAKLTPGWISKGDELDKWGRPFSMTCIGSEIIVSSAGPDRLHGTFDDISTSDRRR